jgi:hypothetical protein
MKMNKKAASTSASEPGSKNNFRVYVQIAAGCFFALILLVFGFNTELSKQLSDRVTESVMNTVLAGAHRDSAQQKELARRAGFNDYTSYKNNRDQCFSSSWRYCRDLLGEFRVLHIDGFGHGNTNSSDKADYIEERSRNCTVQEQRHSQALASLQEVFDELQGEMHQIIDKSPGSPKVVGLLERSKRIAKSMMFAPSFEPMKDCHDRFAIQNNLCVISDVKNALVRSPIMIKQKCERRLAVVEQLSNL